jgi:hypothetical protein
MTKFKSQTIKGERNIGMKCLRIKEENKMLKTQRARIQTVKIICSNNKEDSNYRLKRGRGRKEPMIIQKTGPGKELQRPITQSHISLLSLSNFL